jgi:hypothetical protein
VKRLPLIITLLFAAAIVGSYFYYTNFYNRQGMQAWDLVPPEAILVYEPGTCTSCKLQAQQSPVGEIMKRSSFATTINDFKEIGDFLAAMDFSLVSLHTIKKDDFDFIFYGSIKKNKYNNLDSLIQKLKSVHHAKITQREFNSVQIHEATFQKNVLSWALIDNVWVASFTPFLVEDVVRTHESDNGQAFKSRVNVTKTQLTKSGDQAGNLYVHLPNFSKWLSVFTDQKLPYMLTNLGTSISLDAKVADKNIVLNGFSSDSSAQTAYSLSIFGDQSPVASTLKQFISNRTAMVVSYGVSDGAKMNRAIRSFANNHRVELNDSLARLTKELNISTDELVNDIKGEVGLAYVESRERKLAKILMVQTSNVENWIKAMNALSAKLSIDTVFLERFSEYEIRELPLHHFPEKVLWPLVSGFKTSFYTSLGNTILIAEDIEELKKVLDDYDREETWGKSVSQNQFLETTLLEANLSVYINTPKVWNVVASRLRPEWSDFVQKNKSLLTSLKMGAIQFSHFNETYYTNVSWTYGGYARKEEKVSTPRSAKTITNFSKAIYKSFVVESHVSKEDQLLIQDSSYHVSLTSAEGKVLWQLPLGEPIVGQVHQIDYFGNSKIQYLFATASTLYLIDRLGKSVDPFPVQLQIRDAEHVSVIDYDHSKKYRFLIATRSGKLWMYDKDGKALEGWKPNDVEGPLLIAARHHRLKGKDYLIAIRTDGTVYLMNRRGETFKNFPLKLDTRLSGNYFLEIGNSISNTYFVVIAREGFKIRVSLEGKILNRETLTKTSADAQYSLICDANRRSYIVARQENKQLTLFAEDGREILKNDFIGLHRSRIEYYDFGAGNVYYSITDLQEDLSFIYDGRGNLITQPPLEHDWIGIRQHENESLDVFGTLRETLTIQQLR